ncbi:hypothetical protein B0J11DRAFT_445667 [Dendryphion nanum]|uniref:Uncharacterized protein n=1 Tax=Dendryphion nanum TaxID=256645 RepID=A0A9P9D7N8_9PLEO|nr:hypothetical protein B0J11DRAFT_445667 [Dendryphion nanum]
MELSEETSKDIQTSLPESWMWDVDFHPCHSQNTSLKNGCWTCTPSDPSTPTQFPLTIGNAPVIIPVEHRWPPIAGVNPPPDPRPSALIDYTADMPLDVIRDVFLTFDGSIGFYLLANGMLQIIVDEDFDAGWASSHLPHKYGGLRVCYITQSMEPTMLPSRTETAKSRISQSSHGSSSKLSNMFSPSRASSASQSHTSALSLKLNDFIEVRSKSSHRKEKFAGRIGMKVVKDGELYLVMSTHVITEAILAKSQRSSIFGRSRDPLDQLEGDWNEQVEIWAGNEKIGLIDKCFDPEPGIYPKGFMHDVTLVKSNNVAVLKDVKSPEVGIGWLSREGWSNLRQNSNTIKILGETESQRAAKTLKTNHPSEVLVVGKGIFLNQTSGIKPTKDYDLSAWESFVSRALLYRVYPDFDPPNGYSGIALHNNGLREDGTTGPGVIGFQSFVQRSGHVQRYEMEGGALEQRLSRGQVAFYGAFQVPEALRKQWSIV